MSPARYNFPELLKKPIAKGVPATSNVVRFPVERCRPAPRSGACREK